MGPICGTSSRVALVRSRKKTRRRELPRQRVINESVPTSIRSGREGVDVTERPDSRGKLFGPRGALCTVPNITLQSDRNCVTELMNYRAARNAAVRVSIAPAAPRILSVTLYVRFLCSGSRFAFSSRSTLNLTGS